MAPIWFHLSIFDYWQSCVSRNYSVWLPINEFIYFHRLVFRHNKFELISFSFHLEPPVHALLYYIGFAIYIQIIAEWLRSYSSNSPIPLMTQHSTSLLIFGTQWTSLLIFWTFILMHSIAICFSCTLFWCTQLPSLLCCSLIIERPRLPQHCTSHIKQQLNLCHVLFRNHDIPPPPVTCIARTSPNKINNAASWPADPGPINLGYSTSTIVWTEKFHTVPHHCT